MKNRELIEFGEHLRERAVSYREEPFTLRAGGTSHWYCDLRRGLARGRDMAKAAGFVAAKARARGIKYNTVASMGIGGGLASALAVQEGVYHMEVNDDRSPGQRYGYGVHGIHPSYNTDILGYDDTGTTGDSLVTIIGIIRDEGGDVEHVINVVDRSQGAVARRLAEIGVTLHAIYNFVEDGGLLVPAA